MNNRTGLRQRIANAKNASGIALLLAEGANYPDASPVTRRAWNSTAQRRIKQLETKTK
jgi:hypothetical protein